MVPRELLEQIVVNSNDAIVICEDAVSLPIVFVNESFEKMSGYKADEVLGKHPGRLLQGPHTNPDTKERLRTSLDNKEPVRVQILNYTKSGNQYWVELSIFHHHCVANDTGYYISMQRDVTEQKELQETLLDFKEFFDAAPVAMIRTDLETGKFLYANEMAAKMLGFQSVPDLLENGRSIDFYPMEDRATLIDEMNRRGYVKGYEIKITLTDGKVIWVSANLHINCGGTCIEGSLADITELVKIKKNQLEIANSLAQNISLLNQ